jgi:tetratricopeptide (TPR) repeat protein
MKSIVLSLMLVVAGTGLFAQRLERAKDLLDRKKIPEAIAEVDKALANEKNKNNAEAYYVKGKIYSTIAADSTKTAANPGAKDSAFVALKKYMDLENSNIKDSAKRFILLTMDNRKPITDLYAGYSKEAASFYNAGNYNDALKGFKGSLDVFDLLSKQGWTNGIILDTVSTLYAGISAEKGNKLDTAAYYYGKIAQAKAKAEGYESIYKWLADYYKGKNDLTNAGKYIDLGKTVYPDDPFWNTFELSMLGEKGSPDQLFAKYEEVLKQDANNHAIWYNYAAEIYNTAYNEDTTKRPANVDEYLNKAIEKIQKSIDIKNDYPNSRYLKGIIYTAKADQVDKKNKAIRPSKTGSKLSPEELKQKENLRNDMKVIIDSAIAEFEQVDGLLGKQGKLKMEDKQMLKDTYDRLIIFYEQRQDEAKATAYTDKFNNVDKVH